MEYLGEIRETSEPVSKSSNDSNEEEIEWKQEYYKLKNELDYFNEKYRNTLAKIQSLSLQFEDVIKIVDSSTRSLLETLADELKAVYKDSRHSRASSFNIEGTMNLKISPKTRRKLLFDDIPVESETNEEMEVIERLKEKNIKLNKKIIQLERRNKELQNLERSAEDEGVLSDVYKKEVWMLKERNLELEKKIDSIGRMELMINEYYRNSIPNVLGYHKRLFEGFVKKVNFLQDKENRVLEVFQELKKEVDEEREGMGIVWRMGLVVVAVVVFGLLLTRYGGRIQYS